MKGFEPSCRVLETPAKPLSYTCTLDVDPKSIYIIGMQTLTTRRSAMSRPQELPQYMQEVLSTFEILRRLGIPSELIHAHFNSKERTISCGVVIENKMIGFICGKEIEEKEDEVGAHWSTAVKKLASGEYTDDDLHDMRMASAAMQEVEQIKQVMHAQLQVLNINRYSSPARDIN